ncbi:hypothetical protein F4804DRAFT_315970 [Jackrogersella minutella]|nr:hypothetical protein F4804DRAFT_315970 [Jackrogersella minutella]
MSNMSRNNSSNSLMGFSVHQPAIGAPLQFFPAMGSKQLDEMINTYITGNASIADKRAAVAMEFFDHSMATGELFKFFMVYPSLDSATESPTSSMLDSGYGSNFTSPVMSENQWTQASSTPLLSSGSKNQKPSTKRSALSNDFSHLPGMKIITKDGRDVTNMTSRGCKTKEQRDHAHLMRIIKACDSCRRKKVRCDPSHKRSAGSSTAKASKKTKKTAGSSSVPLQPALVQPLQQFSHVPSFGITDEASSLSFDSVTSESESLTDPTLDWCQFIQFDEQPTEAIPTNYDFLFNPQNYLSPTYNSFSSLQPTSPAQTLGIENMVADTAEGETQAPLPPYLNPGGQAGNNYADFDLYSPGSSTSLDDDPSLSTEISVMPPPQYSEYSNHPRLLDSPRWETSPGGDRNFDTQPDVSRNAKHRTSLSELEQVMPPNGLDNASYHERKPLATYGDYPQLDQIPEWYVPVTTGGFIPLPRVKPDGPGPQGRPVSSLAGVDLPLTGGNLPLTRRGPASSRQQGFQLESCPPPTGSTIARSGLTDLQSQQKSVTMLTNGAGLLDTLDRGLGLRHPQKSIPDEASATSSSTLESYSSNRVSSSSVSSPGRIPVMTNTTGCQTISDTHRDDSYATSSSTGLSPQNTAVPSVPTKSEVSSRRVLAVSLSGSDKDVLHSAILAAAISAAILNVLPLLVLGVLCRWLLPSEDIKEMETIPAIMGSLHIASGVVKLREYIAESADMFHLSTQPLSFLRRLPLTVVNSMKSRHLQIFGGFSGFHCNFEKKYTAQPSNGAKGTNCLQRVTRLV